MSLYLGDVSGKPLLHVTKAVHTKSYMETSIGPDTLLHTDKLYIALEHVATIEGVFGNSVIPSYQSGWHFGTYTLPVDVINSSEIYIGVSRDLYTNKPIIYSHNTVVEPYYGYWAYDNGYGSPKGAYGYAAAFVSMNYFTGEFIPPSIFAYALGSTLSGVNTYTAATYTPDLELYKLKTIDLSNTSEILVANGEILFDNISIFKSNLVGFGPLMNSYDVSDTVSSTSLLFQLLNYSSNSIKLVKDKIFAVLEDTSYELVGTGTSYLADFKSFVPHSNPGNSVTFPVPEYGFSQVKMWIRAGAEEFAKYVATFVLTIDADTPSGLIRRFNYLVNDANAVQDYTYLYYINNNDGTGKLYLSHLPDYSQWFYIQTANIHTIKVTT